MAYTTVALIKSMFRDITIEAATGDPETEGAITTEEIDVLIAEQDAFIDGKLYDFYETPITGANALLVVGRISKLLVSHDVKTILSPDAVATDKDQPLPTSLRKQAMEMLDDIMPFWDAKCCEWVDPVITLSDATRKSLSPKGSNVFDSNHGTATITKGGNNW